MASSKKPRHGELSACLKTFLKQTIQPGQRVLLGLSGGLDSCVLLHLLVGLRADIDIQLQALHVNHGISPNAPEWERFCAALCASYRVPYVSVCVEVARNSGLGIEAAARQERYAVLLSQPVDAVILAHHRDDQAETLLLQLLRGAGVKGVAAMPMMVEHGIGPALLRPLLDVPRTVLERYAGAHNLHWIEDESNLDLAYDRNFLRHQVFPALEQRFPASRTTLARSAAHFAEAAQLLDEVAQEDASHWVRQGRLGVDGLRKLSLPRARNLLRFWLATHLEASPNTRRLHEIFRQLIEARADAQVCIPVESGRVHRYRDEAWFEPSDDGWTKSEMRWQGEASLDFPGGSLKFLQTVGRGLSLAKVQSAGLSIRARMGGERFRPDDKRPTRSLRHLFQAAGTPPWEREALPLLYLGDTLAVVPGIGIACELQAGEEEASLDIHWQRRY